jgi:hypothetical protein
MRVGTCRGSRRCRRLMIGGIQNWWSIGEPGRDAGRRVAAEGATNAQSGALGDYCELTVRMWAGVDRGALAALAASRGVLGRTLTEPAIAVCKPTLTH